MSRQRGKPYFREAIQTGAAVIDHVGRPHTFAECMSVGDTPTSVFICHLPPEHEGDHESRSQGIAWRFVEPGSVAEKESPTDEAVGAVVAAYHESKP